MKDQKFCFSRTLVYLVLLVAVGAGIFYGINYVNNQKLGGKPRAQDATFKCPRYTTLSNGMKVRYPYRKDYDTQICYGFTGRYITNDSVIDSLPGDKIANDPSFKGCYLEPIPCVVYDKSKITKDDSCTVPGYHWVSNPSLTGRSIQNGKDSSYVFKDICVRNTGYSVISYKMVETGNYSEALKECLTTTQGVSEWNCNSPTKVPTPTILIDDSGKVTYNPSTRKTLIISAEDKCPKDQLVWNSYLYDNQGNEKDAADFDWSNSQAYKAAVISSHSGLGWDMCLQFTGKAQVYNDGDTCEVKLRCITKKSSNKNCEKYYTSL